MVSQQLITGYNELQLYTMLTHTKSVSHIGDVLTCNNNGHNGNDFKHIEKLLMYATNFCINMIYSIVIVVSIHHVVFLTQSRDM